MNEQRPRLASVDGLSTCDLHFGPFVLMRRRKALFRDGLAVPLGSRATDLLALLVERAGTIVTKREIMDLVWPETTVVDANISVQIASLRQVLRSEGSDPSIVTVPGRGYRFIGEVTPFAAPPPGHENPSRTNNLPTRLIAAIGRAREIDEVVARIEAHRLVTLSGSAGVGKTTVALLAAETRSDHHADGIWLIDLSPIVDPKDIVSTIATTLGIRTSSADPLRSVVDALDGLDALLVVDNCEHLVEEVAAILTVIATSCTSIRILATSREPLNAIGENLYRLPPLEVPPPNLLVGVDEVIAYPAVQLLVQRAAAVCRDFRLDDSNALSAALICRRLDGLPLAIEFAAALVEPFGMEGLAARLDEHLRFIGLDRRGGVERHRTLDAALDWSYRLLDETERTVLRRLAIFAGGFTLQAAEAVVPSPDETLDIPMIVARLALKSLVSTVTVEGEARLRLLETTRAFGCARLADRQEAQALARRHAVFFRDMLSARRRAADPRQFVESAADIDNIRSALRHALGPDGDTDLALGLASAALPVWFGHSLLRECHDRLHEIGERLTAEQRDSPEGWNIAVALRNVEMFTRGVARGTLDSWTGPPEKTTGHADAAPKGAHLLTSWMWNLRLPNNAETMRLANIYANIAKRRDTLTDRIMLSAVLGMTAHHLGDLEKAQRHLMEFLVSETPDERRRFLGQTGYDRRPSGLALLGVTMCLMGECGEGLRYLQQGEREARATGRILSLCETLMWRQAARLLTRQEEAAARAALPELTSLAERHSLDSHFGVALGMEGIYLARNGDLGLADERLRHGLSLCRRSNFGQYIPWFTGVLASTLARLGRPHEAIATLDAHRASDPNLETWCTPEYLRHRAIAEHVSGAAGTAIEHLDKAAEMAASQRAYAWSAAIAETRRQILEPKPDRAAL